MRKRIRKRTRYLFWAALGALFAEWAWWMAQREPKWVEANHGR